MLYHFFKRTVRDFKGYFRSEQILFPRPNINVFSSLVFLFLITETLSSKMYYISFCLIVQATRIMPHYQIESTVWQETYITSYITRFQDLGLDISGSSGPRSTNRVPLNFLSAVTSSKLRSLWGFLFQLSFPDREQINLVRVVGEKEKKNHVKG